MLHALGVVYVAAGLAAGGQAPPATIAASPEMAAIYDQWIECLAERVDAAPSEGSADAAADAVMAGCKPVEDRLVAAHATFLEASKRSPQDREKAVEAMRASLAEARRAILETIEEDREE